MEVKKQFNNIAADPNNKKAVFKQPGLKQRIKFSQEVKETLVSIIAGEQWKNQHRTKEI